MELLGAVRAWRCDWELEVGAGQQRAVLGVLATRVNRPVSRSDLIDALWGDSPPASAASVVYTYITRLRRALGPSRPQQKNPAGPLSSGHSGYVLHLEPGQVDADVFAQHLRRAQQLRAAGDLIEAVGSFDAALAMWHGTPWAEVPGPFAEGERVRLTEQYLTAVEDRADICVAIGDLAGLVAELSRTARDYPFRERLAGLLMLALYRSARQADALAFYRQIRHLLRTELGIEPCRDLQRLHEQILTADSALCAPSGTDTILPADARETGSARPVPAELPHDVAKFAGRGTEIACLYSLMREEGTSAQSALVIAAIDGIAGTGKSALAVHFAHRISGAFPDGQLFLDLRGFDPKQPPLLAGEALSHFLRSLGAAPGGIPSALDEQVGMYRSLLASRRVLIVLDNAATTEQIRPLLPGTSACAVIVTSRERLDGLIARDGAHRVVAGPLSAEDAVALLSGVAGRERVAAETEAARRLVQSCGYLPLAIRIAAERIIARPGGTIGAMADELSDERRRLDMLAVDNDPATAVRAAFQWSYRALSPEAAWMFSQLGLLAGPEASPVAVSALANRTLQQTRRLLDVLARAHLLEWVDGDRVRLHDLLRLYARECAAAEPLQARSQAIRRMLNWYLHTAEEAGHVLMPQQRRVPKEPLEEGCTPLSFTTHRQALRWCETERDNLVAAVHQAAEIGDQGLAWRLPAVLWIFFSLGRHWHDWLATSRVGLAAARSIGDREGQSHLLGNLGVLNSDRRNLAEAIDCFQQALAICEELGDLHGQGMSQLGLGIANHRQKQYETSVEHHRQALRILSETGDRWGGNVALDSLSTIHHALGQTEKAIGYLQVTLAACRDLGDRWFEATVLSHLADACLETQQFHDAIGQYKQALAIRCQIGDRRGQARALTALGNAYSAMRQFGDAISHYEQALALNRDIEDQQGQARTLDALRAAQQNAGSRAPPAWRYAHPNISSVNPRLLPAPAPPAAES